MSISAAILLVFSSLMAMPQGAKEDRSREMERRRRWQRLSQEDQSRLVDRLRRWKSLPLEKRKELRRRMEKFHRLPPEERERLRRRSRRHKDFSVEKQAQLRRRWDSIVKQVLSRLPEKEREEIFALPPKARQARIEALIRKHHKARRARIEKFIQSLPEDVRKELEKLPPHERPMRIRQLMEERRGRNGGPRRPRERKRVNRPHRRAPSAR
ncbi:MAG: DUF3106 domain-containing protein [Planctomycetota bacterium]|nr:DUF3106 domain-containing protein [Planctomycetota bacterium]